MLMESLYRAPGSEVETRWASHENPTGAKGAGGKARAGRKGAAWFALPAGATAVLAKASGTSGMVRRIWITISSPSKETLRSTILEMYWDGCERPAVHVPLGDFFGHGIGHMATFKNALFSSPEGRSFNCFIPMPFKTGMKILVKNLSETQIDNFYYDVDYTLGDSFDGQTLYFHSWFGRQNPTHMKDDFALLPYLEGSGRFLGVNLGIRCNTERYFTTWWGEGEVKVFLDGDTDFPTLCGTGVEDYVATAWGQDYYYDLYHGSPIYDKEKMEISCYRFHIPDPVYFHKNIKVTVQQIGGVDSNDELNKARLYFNQKTKGYVYTSVDGSDIDFLAIDSSVVKPVLFEREDDWSCCSYFYYDKPVDNLPVLPVEKYLIEED